MNLSMVFSVMPLYAGLLGLLFIVFTLRVGLYRMNSKVSLGDGGDKELLKRIRGQGNFTESVPIALLLLIMMEACGAADVWLHCLGAALVLARLSHYLQITGVIKSLLFRMGGMITSLATVFVSSVWLLVHFAG